MPDFVTAITEELERLRSEDLFRNPPVVDSAQGPLIRVDDRELINFSSNDYLGLSTHPALYAAAAKASADFGAGAGASRLICGTQRPHCNLEEALAAFKGTAAALTFASGYSAALGVIPALLGRDDIIIVDKLVHACVIDAAKLSGATLRVFRHNDLNDLEKKLSWAANKHPEARRLVITESVFSMDGDLAPLLNIVELKERHGAWLMVDEAHATGLFGERRSGLVEEFELTNQVELQLVTLGKAVGASGGAVCGARPLIDLLINRARSFIYSTAPCSASVAAAQAGIELIRSEEGETLRQRLWAMVDHLKGTLLSAGMPPGVVRAPIVPVILGDESAALERSAQLRDTGLFVPAIRYPTVARQTARLRFTITAAHTLEHLDGLGSALQTATDSDDEPVRPA